MEINAWMDIPTWAPEESQFMYRISAQRAIDQGLTRRPLEETMQAINAWDIERGRPDLKAGMSIERMNELVGTLRVQES
jgi:hypothetical protein